eukprot:COSAG06_NODE_3728_length_4969_cov_2.206897_3_plen_297_part_00
MQADEATHAEQPAQPPGQLLRLPKLEAADQQHETPKRAFDADAAAPHKRHKAVPSSSDDSVLAEIMGGDDAAAAAAAAPADSTKLVSAFQLYLEESADEPEPVLKEAWLKKKAQTQKKLVKAWEQKEPFTLAERSPRFSKEWEDEEELCEAWRSSQPKPAKVVLDAEWQQLVKQFEQHKEQKVLLQLNRKPILHRWSKLSPAERKPYQQRAKTIDRDRRLAKLAKAEEEGEQKEPATSTVFSSAPEVPFTGWNYFENKKKKKKKKKNRKNKEGTQHATDTVATATNAIPLGGPVLE